MVARRCSTRHNQWHRNRCCLWSMHPGNSHCTHIGIYNCRSRPRRILWVVEVEAMEAMVAMVAVAMVAVVVEAHNHNGT